VSAVTGSDIDLGTIDEHWGRSFRRKIRFAPKRANLTSIRDDSLCPATAASRRVAQTNRLLEEILQCLCPARVTELPQRLGFDLANPLASDIELSANLFQRA